MLYSIYRKLFASLSLKSFTRGELEDNLRIIITIIINLESCLHFVLKPWILGKYCTRKNFWRPLNVYYAFFSGHPSGSIPGKQARIDDICCKSLVWDRESGSLLHSCCRISRERPTCNAPSHQKSKIYNESYMKNTFPFQYNDLAKLPKLLISHAVYRCI